MKKILFIINSLRVGGAEKILIDLLMGMDYEKYEVSLVYFVKGGVFLKDVPAPVHCKCIVGMGSRFDNLFRKILDCFGLLDMYYKWCMRQGVGNYDTIVSYLEGFPTRMHSYILDKAVRNISFVHTDLATFRDSADQYSQKYSQEMVYSKMDEIVFVSKHAKESFMKVFPNVVTKQTVLPNFIDKRNIYTQSTEKKIEKRGFTVVTIGRLAPVKGVEIIPTIAKYIKNKNLPIYFNIIGDGSDYNNIKQLIKENAVEDVVNMVGFQKNPYPYILASDIYLNTSHTEGMPLSICEAMTLGKPVIATNTSGAIELLEQEHGILVDRTVEQIGDAIIKLYCNENIRMSLAEKGIELSNQFDKHIYLTNFYKLI